MLRFHMSLSSRQNASLRQYLAGWMSVGVSVHERIALSLQVRWSREGVCSSNSRKVHVDQCAKTVPAMRFTNLYQYQNKKHLVSVTFSFRRHTV